jgi:hypothetical protein
MDHRRESSAPRGRRPTKEEFSRAPLSYPLNTVQNPSHDSTYPVLLGRIAFCRHRHGAADPIFKTRDPGRMSRSRREMCPLTKDRFRAKYRNRCDGRRRRTDIRASVMADMALDLRPPPLLRPSDLGLGRRAAVRHVALAA